MAGRSLNPATHRRHGGPLPRRLPNGPRPHPLPSGLSRPLQEQGKEYPVLAQVSLRYPGVGAGWSRVTHPFATLFTAGAVLIVRLACVRHAASVHPEPGSNSPFEESGIAAASVRSWFSPAPPAFGGLGSPGGHLSIRFISQYPVFKVLASPSGGLAASFRRAAHGDTYFPLPILSELFS